MGRVAPPPYSPRHYRPTTLDDLESTVAGISGDRALSHFQDILIAFKAILATVEQTKVSRDQLKVLRSCFTRVLDVCARQSDIGVDVDHVLPNITKILNTLSHELESKAKLETVPGDPYGSQDLKAVVGKAYDAIDAQLRETIPGQDEERILYRASIVKAQANDQKRFVELDALTTQSNETFNQSVLEVLKQALEIIHDTSEVRWPQEAKQALVTVGELSGRSLPASTFSWETKMRQCIDYDVYTAELVSGGTVAVKVPKERVRFNYAQEALKSFEQELATWTSMRAVNIFPIYGARILSSPFSEVEFQLHMTSPNLQNGEILSYLKKHSKASPQSRLQMIYDIARGLQYMHEDSGLELNGVVHGTLNLSHRFVKDSNRTVISGFGQDQITKVFQESLPSNSSGYRYMAPEMFDEFSSASSSDVWSWAMTSLEILTDEPPYGGIFEGPHIMQAVGQGKKPKRSDHPKIEEYLSPDTLWEIFESCWDLDPEHRPLASEIVSKIELAIQHSILAGQVKNTKVLLISNNMPTDEVVHILGHHNCPDVSNRLDLKSCSTDPIALGRYSDIYHGQLLGGTKVAIKCMRLNPQSTGESRNALTHAARELGLWSRCSHSNVHQLLGLAQFRGQISIVSPWADTRGVLGYLESKPDADLYHLWAQVSNGLAHLHQQTIIHGDIKGQNIIVADDGVPMLTDFGLHIWEGGTYSMMFTGETNTSRISTRWAAPEILEGRNYSLEGDVYALGMTILEMMTGEPPYASCASDTAVLTQVLVRRQIPERPPDRLPTGSVREDTLWMILTRCWAFDPKARPSAKDLKISLRLITRKELTKASNPLFHGPSAWYSRALRLESPGHSQSEVGLSMQAGGLLLSFISLKLSEPLCSLCLALLLYSTLYFSLVSSLCSLEC